MARRARQISLRECYEILRLEKGADLQAVKRAYRKRAFELHPDLNPGNQEASRQFQLLNEAYVALSAMLKPAEEARQKAQKEDAQAKQEQTAENRKEEKTNQKAEASASKAQQAYAEQDVLRDLLNDPFARRVFEDIYSELNKKQEQPRQGQQYSPPPPPPGPEKKAAKPDPTPRSTQARVAPLWEENQDKGVKKLVKGWLRRQIDEEQTLVLPAARLAPGRKIRLQIRRGLSDDLNAVEVTLPPDFQVGKPVRLRGLGRRVGPWQGDLYLTIHTA